MEKVFSQLSLSVSNQFKPLNLHEYNQTIPAKLQLHFLGGMHTSDSVLTVSWLLKKPSTNFLTDGSSANISNKDSALITYILYITEVISLSFTVQKACEYVARRFLEQFRMKYVQEMFWNLSSLLTSIIPSFSPLPSGISLFICCYSVCSTQEEDELK
jgi:hypothetical protein